jgi:hypothetical protein
METDRSDTSPQRAEGITACRWAPFEEARTAISYANARLVLERAYEMVSDRAAQPPGGAALESPLDADSSVAGLE